MDERHRHRYEVNPNLVPDLEEKGLRFVGKDESGQRMEIVELKGHPYFVAGQFHPEFKSRPGKPSPLFLGLILASSGQPLPISQILRRATLCKLAASAEWSWKALQQLFSGVIVVCRSLGWLPLRITHQSKACFTAGKWPLRVSRVRLLSIHLPHTVVLSIPHAGGRGQAHRAGHVCIGAVGKQHWRVGIVLPDSLLAYTGSIIV